MRASAMRSMSLFRRVDLHPQRGADARLAFDPANERVPLRVSREIGQDRPRHGGWGVDPDLREISFMAVPRSS
jgi:hypothetical protein